MKKTIILFIGSLLVFVLAAGAGCGERGLTIEEGRLKMYGNENVGFLEVKNGKPTGFSAELAEAIAGRLGLEPEVALMPFSNLFSRLTADICDIAMSAITITPERREKMDFSEPYFTSGQCLLVPKDSGISDVADLKRKEVGVIRGTTNEQLAKKIEGVGEIRTYDYKPDMFDALAGGALDAVIVDTPFALYNVNSTGKTRIAKGLTSGERYGIAVRKGNARLLVKINGALEEIRRDGTYDRIYEKYFGGKP